MLLIHSNLIYSQNGLEKLSKDNETYILLSVDYVKKLNILKFNYDECKEIQKELFNKITTDSLLIEGQRSQISLLKDSEEIYQKMYNNQLDIEKELNKQLKSYKRKNRILKFCIFVSLITTGILIFK